ncbi:hypothetical protein D3C76_1538000 [compost metagenome]
MIAFACSGVVARREGANELNIEFSDVESCRRLPALDGYAGRPGGVPWRVLVEEHGWSQECGHCQGRVYSDEPERVWVADQVYCSAVHQDLAVAFHARLAERVQERR